MNKFVRLIFALCATFFIAGCDSGTNAVATGKLLAKEHSYEAAAARGDWKSACHDARDMEDISYKLVVDPSLNFTEDWVRDTRYKVKRLQIDACGTMNVRRF